MAIDTIGKILTNLVSDVKNFRTKLDGVPNGELFSNYELNREWDNLTTRFVNYRHTHTMLTQTEKNEFASKYGNERDELAGLVDEINKIVKEKSTTRAKYEAAGKIGSVVNTGVIVGGIVVSTAGAILGYVLGSRRR